VAILRRSFKKALIMTLDGDEDYFRVKRSSEGLRKGHLKKLDQVLAQELADQMKNMNQDLVRKIRAGKY
jgi:hypothetical protein